MKRIAVILVIVLATLSIFAYKTFASKPVNHSKLITHPGRTNRYGCHTCRTNCPRWGLEYGEYHCH